MNRNSTLGFLVCLFLATLQLPGLSACGGRQVSPAPVVVDAGTQSGPSGWPTGLPVDQPQPWETFDASGNVVPADRLGSVINLDSELAPGVAWYLASGDVTENGEAATVQSTAGGLGYALYRIPLGGVQPGAVSIDANPLTGAGYYVGLADYGNAEWQWHGPFTDNHVRISPGPGDYLSGLGSVFVAVVAWEGAGVDVIGVGINPLDPADGTPPAPPLSPAVTPVNGGLYLEWLPVAAADLAGYRICYSSATFSSPEDPMVAVTRYLEGSTHHLLTTLSGMTYVAISAVDLSGNESALSPLAAGTPADGDTVELTISLSQPSALLNDPVTLTATGAATYSIDIDGDGIFEITDSPSGTATVSTTGTGIIRPFVLASGEGQAVACGGVSLIVASNSRPMAYASAAPVTGDAPLLVGFDGSASYDFDGDIVGGGWDFDGDGYFDAWSETDPGYVISTENTYTVPGLYNAKLLVIDDQGVLDVDTVAISVNAANQPPVADIAVTGGTSHPYAGVVPLTVTFDPAASYDPDGTIVKYEWDLEGDGHIDYTFSTPRTLTKTYYCDGYVSVKLYVTDDQGSTVGTTGQVYPVLWDAEGAGVGHTGESTVWGPMTDSYRFDVTWDRGALSSPVINLDDRILYGDDLGYLHGYCLTGYSWDIGLGASLSGRGPVLDSLGNIYVCDAAQHLFKLTLDGNLVYMVDLGGAINSTPLVDESNGLVYCLLINGELQARHIGNGTAVWVHSTGAGTSNTSPTLSGGMIIYGDDLGKLHSVDYLGYEAFTPYTGVGGFWPPAADTGNMEVVCSNFHYPGGAAEVFCVNSYTLALVWSVDLTGEYPGPPCLNTQQPVSPNGDVYVGCESRNLYALDLATGDELWTAPFVADGAIYCRPVVAFDHAIYLGDDGGKVYCVDAADGSVIWSHGGLGARFINTPIITSGERLVMLDDSANLYFFWDL